MDILKKKKVFKQELGKMNREKDSESTMVSKKKKKKKE